MMMANSNGIAALFIHNTFWLVNQMARSELKPYGFHVYLQTVKNSSNFQRYIIGIEQVVSEFEKIKEIEGMGTHE